MSFRWQKIDINQTIPHHLDKNDVCYYAREYIAEGGYKASETNQLISNFKKEVLRKRNPNEWRYKLIAIDQFADELSEVFHNNTAVAQIPCSKKEADSDYDNRLESTLAKLNFINKTIRVVKPFQVRTTLKPSHHGGTRSVSELYENLEWLGIPSEIQWLFLIDDVITTGAHFKACQQLLREKCPNVEVGGVFWAKTVWREQN